MLAGFALFGIGIWGYSPIRDAKRNIKIGINSAIARSHGISYSHRVSPGLEFDAAAQYGLIPNYDRAGFEDHWYGRLQDHSFSLYEVHLEDKRRSDKRTYWVTIFRGAIINIDFGRQFNSTTLLQRKGKHKKFWIFGGRADHATFDGHTLDYVDQVHPDFEDVFEVWSDDQIEARVLIHPSYVEHLLALERAFEGDAVRALFRRGEVIIAVESGNLFESGSMDAATDHFKVTQSAEQFAALAQLAIAINQNERGQAGMDTPV